MMFKTYSLALMIAVIVFGFIALIYIINFNPKRLAQGESLCQKYYSFYKRKIDSGKIISITKISSDHGAWELELVEADTLYNFRFYEPLYDDINFIDNNFKKKENSFELILDSDIKYKIIRTCDKFY